MPEILDPNDPHPQRVVGEDEILDLVDIHDRVVGVTNQKHVYDGFRHLLNGFFVRKAGLLLINDEGELWIPKRQPWKLLAPNGYDFSADEHVHAGESRRAAAKRGAEEELAMRIKKSELAPVTSLGPSETGTVYHTKVFAYLCNESPEQFSTADYTGGEWFARHVILDVLACEGVPQKATLAASIRALPKKPQKLFS